MDYKKGKIYKIVCDETGLDYYGSTIRSLNERLRQHKEKYNECQTKLMTNPKIYLVEEYPCETREQLLMRERWWIENNWNKCCNKVVPLQTIKEYREKYREQILKQRKKYREENKEHIAEKSKKYREKNKERIDENQKEYRKKNKELITCECGSLVTKHHIARHYKSKKHQKYISSLENKI